MVKMGMLMKGGLLLTSALFYAKAECSNATQVQQALNAAAPSPGSDLAFVIGVIDGLSGSVKNSALNQLQPSLFNAEALSQENNALSVTSALVLHMQEFYETDCTRGCPEEKKITFWADLLGDVAKQESIQNQLGFRTATGGATLGVDYGCLNNFILGAALAYTHSDLEWKRSIGHSDIDSYYASLYTIKEGEIFYVNAALLGAFNQYSASRRIKFSDIQRHAKSHHSGGELASRVEGGMFIPYRGLDVRPFDSLEYIYLHEGSFSERGAKSLDLKIHAKTSMLLRNELGGSFASCISFNRWSFVPNLKLSWVREWRFHGRHTTAKFKDTESDFTATGMKPDRSLFAVGVGFTGLFLQERLRARLDYHGEFQTHYWDQNINIQASFAF